MRIGPGKASRGEEGRGEVVVAVTAVGSSASSVRSLESLDTVPAKIGDGPLGLIGFPPKTMV